MRSDEIERAWEIMDPIIAATQRTDGPKPQLYTVGTDGPECGDKLLANEGRKWMDIV
jgi:glucose-6-phosphate 1-dehydrogenase